MIRPACVLWLALLLPGGAQAADWAWSLPPGFPVPLVPADNPMSAAKVELGRRLFSEGRLAADGQLACIACHRPELAYTQGQALPRGAAGQALAFNAPTLANVAYLPAYGWASPTVTTLEAQMRTPLLGEHPVEMGLAGREAQVLALLRAEAGYARDFAAAFPDDTQPVSTDNLIRAIAAYERTLVSGRSAFDRYVFDAELKALTPAAKRGMGLFYSERLGCGECHAGLNFSGPVRAVGHELAQAVFVRGLRVPGLRNVALTAPYLHDGSLPTLRAVIDFYDRGGHQRPLRPLRLSAREKADLQAFLASLSDP